VTKEDLKAWAASESDESWTTRAVKEAVLRLLAEEEEGRVWICPWCQESVRSVLKPSGGCLFAEKNGGVWHPRCADEVEALQQVKAQEEARGEVVAACPRCSAHEPSWIPEAGCWHCDQCMVDIDTVAHWQRVLA
jgi:rubrerythrin